jgi:hypothetical protein
MRSPNGRFFCVVAEPNGNDHLVEGRSDSTLCGRQITDLWLTARGLVDSTYGDRHVVCRSCDTVANGRVPSEVAPRSSGGAPNAARTLTEQEADALIDEYWVASIEMWRADVASLDAERNRYNRARAALRAALLLEPANVE